MKILVLTPDYPDEKRSTFSFVKQLVDEMARQGHSLQVIAPYSVTHNRRFCHRASSYYVGTNKVTVYRPYYISLSNIRIGKIGISDFVHNLAYKRGFSMLQETPDVVYGHFWNSAYMGFSYAQSNHIPLFVATGESEIEFRADDEDKKAFCSYLSGVICVSTKNQDESIQLGLVSKKKCIVLPNAIDNRLFRLIDKGKCRTQLNISQSIFIVAFVGWFSDRKGSKRVSQAIDMISEGAPVYSFFIGEGSEEPDCPNIILKGKIKHNEVPIYLNAADVFVLPTQHEGCCNAIIEAMACGLPVISSDLPFNYDVLSAKNSILVDPNDVDQIKQSIVELRDNKDKRNRLALNALETAKELTITERAQKIITYIKNTAGYDVEQ